MGAIQSKINNILGSFGAMALATNKYNQGVIASEDKALQKANANYEASSKNAMAEGKEAMVGAIQKMQQKKKEEAKALKITRQQALQKAMEEIQERFNQKREFDQRMSMKIGGKGAIGYEQK